jgi:putative DNA primase/helicase
MTFLEIALPLIVRGFYVTPLEGKAPFLDNWPESASRDDAVIRAWAEQYPEANVGIVASKSFDNGTWSVDFDDPDWYLKNLPTILDRLRGMATEGDAPQPYQLCSVQTGSGKWHYHFLYDAYSLNALKNFALPNTDPEGESKNFFEVKADRVQCVGPGSLHPDTKKAYVWDQDHSHSAASHEFVDWLMSFNGRSRGSQELRVKIPRLKKSWDPEVELASAGLKFTKETKGNEVYFNYHTMNSHGCLIKGEKHQNSNSNNNACCAFVFRPKTREFYHTCFASGCQGKEVSKTRTALQGLRIDITKISQSGRPKFNTKRDTEVIPEIIRWLNEGLIPLGKVTIFAGDPGLGKSLVSHDLTARGTSGQEFPNGQTCPEEFEVLLMSSEDSYADTVLPRLIVAGRKPGSVHFLESCIVDEKIDRQFALDSDIESMREFLEENPKVKLVVLDPISSYFGDGSMNKQEGCRARLDPLGKLARDMRVAIVVIAHFSKNVGLSAAHKVSGSVAIVAASRLAWGFFKDLADESLVHMLVLKSNIDSVKKGFKYKIVRHLHPVDPENKTGVPKIDWQGESQETANKIVTARESKDVGEQVDCLKWLKEELAAGKRVVGEIISKGKVEGFSESTVKRAARSLPVKKSREGHAYNWSLLEGPEQMSISEEKEAF